MSRHRLTSLLLVFGITGLLSTPSSALVSGTVCPNEGPPENGYGPVTGDVTHAAALDPNNPDWTAWTPRYQCEGPKTGDGPNADVANDSVDALNYFEIFDEDNWVELARTSGVPPDGVWDPNEGGIDVLPGLTASSTLGANGERWYGTWSISGDSSWEKIVLVLKDGGVRVDGTTPPNQEEVKWAAFLIDGADLAGTAGNWTFSGSWAISAHKDISHMAFYGIAGNGDHEVPEPLTAMLLATGLVGVTLGRRRPARQR